MQEQYDLTRGLYERRVTNMPTYLENSERQLIEIMYLKNTVFMFKKHVVKNSRNAYDGNGDERPSLVGKRA